MDSKVLREIIIILLLVIVIIFAFGILFYDCISADREIIYSEEYVTDSNVSKVLEEIQENSGVDIQNESSNYLLKSYSINQEDLTTYASDNSYESGKKDPFAEDSEDINEVTNVTETTAKTTNAQTNNYIENNEKNKNTNTVNKQNEVTANKVESNTTSTPGTFFENKNSK